MALRDRLIFNVKWHRRIGLFCAFFVFILSVTGLLLNHTSSLGLDNIKVRSSLISSLYNLPTANPVSFKTGEHWVSHNGINELYLGEDKVERCTPPLKGAISIDGLLAALCENELLLLTTDGALLERITSVFGLPENSLALAVYDHRLLINTPNGIVETDIDSLDFTPTTFQAPWTTSQTPPEELAQLLTSHGPSMDLEQVILDLHSGRLFGIVGVLIMDLVAILLIVLAVTGFIAWNTSRRMRSGKR